MHIIHLLLKYFVFVSKLLLAYSKYQHYIVISMIFPLQLHPFNLLTLVINIYTTGVVKKVDTVAKRRGCDALARWSDGIKNHLYYSAASSNGDGELMVAKWQSITNHIVDDHEGHSDIFTKCDHGPLERDWLAKGTVLPHSIIKSY